MLRRLISSLPRYFQKLRGTSATRYMVRDGMPPSLLEFVEPDENVFRSIRGILQEMPLVEEQQCTSADRLPHCSGDIDTILSQLRGILGADILEMQRFTEEEMAVRFDYCVQQDWQDPTGIRVLTHMFRPGREGSISYGPLVKRVAPDRYLLWRS